MKNKNSSPDSLKDHLNTKVSRENIIKLILQNLINRYSLNEIINYIIKITKQNENQIILKDKIPLTPEDIISIIYKSVGPIKLYQCLLDINEEIPSIKSTSKKKQKKSQKCINFSNLKSPLSTIEEEKYLNTSLNNSSYKKDNMIIDIDNTDNIEGSQYKEQEFNGNMSLNENETTIYEIKDGGKTELKKDRKRLEKKRKREKNSSPTHIYGLYSESKRINVPKKLGKVYENKLRFHYILEKGNLYKVRFKEVDSEKEKAKFICDDPKCQGIAEYSIKKKTFKTLKDHTIPNDEHFYNKNIIFLDMNILNYMMKYNIDDLQLTRV
jgi:hypothetical protein